MHVRVSLLWVALHSGAFIIPNKPIKGEASLLKYQVPLKMLENHLGTKLLPQLNPEKVWTGIPCIVRIINVNYCYNSVGICVMSVDVS